MNIKENFSEWWRNHEQRKRDRVIRRLMEQSKEIFQIKEVDRELWITLNGSPVVPETMLNNGIVTSLATIRDLYVARNMSKL